ncbi:hypothetical protein EYZ11_011154 [Aspergillus tanneri]|uniref:Uncharacterized protein n=1 Tax=Aspergillus tanneri TaxID=1220188 RepID=A0A4S3J3I1_9EURO|nr:hypothetical protein EYZ11_011154 [Aspergillus tanneri]
MLAWTNGPKIEMRSTRQFKVYRLSFSYTFDRGGGL